MKYLMDFFLNRKQQILQRIFKTDVFKTLFIILFIFSYMWYYGTPSVALTTECPFLISGVMTTPEDKAFLFHQFNSTINRSIPVGTPQVPYHQVNSSSLPQQQTQVTYQQPRNTTIFHLLHRLMHIIPE